MGLGINHTFIQGTVISWWHTDVIWWRRSQSKFAQVMACYLLTPSLYPNSTSVFCDIHFRPISPEVLKNFVNTLRPRRNEQHFADDIFKRISFNENVWISIKISLKFVPKGPINNIPALVQIMAWCRSGNKPLSEPMMVCLPTHICVTRPQWLNDFGDISFDYYHISLGSMS